mmetsp:Transcript_47651/g.137147  ORF Transcript_47651/g.137147 Transcript_47651/m.137147 type:complete len:441 (-) Transcript_47651:178-1500(-)
MLRERKLQFLAPGHRSQAVSSCLAFSSTLFLLAHVADGGDPACHLEFCAAPHELDDQEFAPFLQTKIVNSHGAHLLDGLEAFGKRWHVEVPYEKFVEQVAAQTPSSRYQEFRALLDVNRFKAMMHSAAVFLTVAIFCLGTQLLVTECLDTCFQVDPCEVADWLMGRCRDSSVVVQIMAASMRFGCSWSHSLFQNFRHRTAVCLCLRRRRPATELDLSSMLPIVHDVAAFLGPEDICRWGFTARAYQSLPDEFCNYPVLMKEVQRLDAEGEWLSCLEAVGSSSCHAAGNVPQPKCHNEASSVRFAPSMLSALRRFLGESRRRRAERERAEALGRCSDVLSDIARCILLAVCWLCFFCQVIGLAQSHPSATTVVMLFKALASPALFLFVLEAVEENLAHAGIAGAIAFVLLMDCVSTGHCHGACGHQPLAVFSSFSQRFPFP